MTPRRWGSRKRERRSTTALPYMRLFHLHSTVKNTAFFFSFPLGGIHAYDIFPVIPLELQGKNISHFLWHGLPQLSLQEAGGYGASLRGTFVFLGRVVILHISI